MKGTSFQKKLFKEIRKLYGDIKEISKYSIPHLVGEIKNQDNGTEISLCVSAMEDALKSPILIEENGTIMFVLPVKNKKLY